MRNFILAIVGIFMFSTSQPATAASTDLFIRSGSDWITTTDPGPDLAWTTTSFDDSTWIAAFAPYPNDMGTPQNVIPNTTAQFMWHWDEPIPPSGKSGPTEAFFRFNFDLDRQTGPDYLGLANVIADDKFELFVNGTGVDTAPASTELDLNMRPNDQPRPVSVNFSEHLKPGPNVLAIRAQDGGRDAQGLFEQRDRLFEFVLFDGAVQPLIPDINTFVIGASADNGPNGVSGGDGVTTFTVASSGSDHGQGNHYSILTFS